MVYANIFEIVFGKFNYRLEFYLVILLLYYKNIKVYLYYIILFFYLTVRLKIKDCGEPLFYTQKVIK